MSDAAQAAERALPPWAGFALAVLAAFAGGGGLGSTVTGRSTSAEVREARAEIVGEVRRLADRIEEHARRLDRLETDERERRGSGGGKR